MCSSVVLAGQPTQRWPCACLNEVCNFAAMQHPLHKSYLCTLDICLHIQLTLQVHLRLPAGSTRYASCAAASKQLSTLRVSSESIPLGSHLPLEISFELDKVFPFACISTLQSLISLLSYSAFAKVRALISAQPQQVTDQLQAGDAKASFAIK